MNKTNKTTTTTTVNSELAFAGDCIDNVRKSFDGLNKAVTKLPESKDKTNIMQWAADTYLAASKTILSLAGNVAPSAA